MLPLCQNGKVYKVFQRIGVGNGYKNAGMAGIVLVFIGIFGRL